MFVCVCADDTCMCVLYLIFKLSDDILHVFFYICNDICQAQSLPV